MPDRIFNVLFLCTGNSARSILAESILAGLGKGRFQAYSAGSHPSGTVNPLVLEFLERQGMPVEAARSKSWDEFARPGAPALDIIITVCDQAAGEACPFWPGQPVTVHWGMEDPARYMSDPEKAGQVIREVFHSLRRRIGILVGFTDLELGRPLLRSALQDIDRVDGNPNRVQPDGLAADRLAE